MALGYGVDVLGQVSWLTKANCTYWGDIDTHGFAILNRARQYLPHLNSILMDEKTLFRYFGTQTKCTLRSLFECAPSL